MSTPDTTRGRRITAALREEERVTPLELFFDLVFVLALTQCTALMADNPTWEGIAQGMLVLTMLWWSWGGYAWLTSVIDPEEGAVRIAIFAAMAAFLVAALSVPGVFGSSALIFACAYFAVRAAHIALFVIASQDDPGLRRSVTGLAVSTAIGAGLLFAAAASDGALQGIFWVVAVAIDMGGPLFVIDSSGWRLAPSHFAERHGLIVIIALGESIAAIGAGHVAALDAGIVAAAALGVTVAAAMWWLYFDVVSIVAERRLTRAAKGREQNEIARDSYSYIHLPMVAGIVLVALGLKETLAGVGAPLEIETAAALYGGAALYLLAHVAFRLRNLGTLNKQRLVSALGLLGLIAAITEVAALAAVALLAAILSALIAYEAIRFAELRDRIRHEVAAEMAAEQAARG